MTDQTQKPGGGACCEWSEIAFHDVMLRTESDPALMVNLVSVASSWGVFDYGNDYPCPADWPDFFARHQETDGSTMHRFAMTCRDVWETWREMNRYRDIVWWGGLTNPLPG